ncbi:E3 ubiquitin-protein ligase RSL1-like [Rhodamnia argentea]|uniref:RBR-type E3 ubiquitin transferase n=1 Tax=Rhodamnia argentea TaxID=178133 RepID=A0A8B8NW68_9MYRT|nr:E3 ubiquitin-protein ligase RSL1-like [Rhodamnia argentea]
MEGDDLQTAVADQRHELVASRALDSDADYDYAFQLQIQEAISASLSPSRPSASGPPPAPPADGASWVGDDEDGRSLATALMLEVLEEMERSAREHEDRAQCEAEFRRMRLDLDRRIHDQRFAAEVFGIPEEEWQDYGDFYHKPFEAGCSSSAPSSSSASSASGECFRVYVKGLVSEEWIKEEKVVVAGLGVAICDFKDNVIIEVKKPLINDILVGDLEAEIEALVQGLHAAVCLDLKRVNALIGDVRLYNYLTGIQSPGQSKITAPLNEATMLQKKLTYFGATLVGPNDTKYAYKLARDAIVSQISWSEETNDGKSLKETCVICFEDSSVTEMFSVEECLHRYCFSCMKRHVEAKLLDGVMIKCPHDGCNSEVKIDSCGGFLEPNVISIMSQRMKEASIAVTERVYCPFPRCSTLMSKHELLEYSKEVFVGAEHGGARKCMKCQFFFCVDCKVPWHYNMSCHEYQRSNPIAAAGDAQLKFLASMRLWRECVKCKNLVELAEGCYHITCRCGHEFCYTCGAEWKKKKATCSCPIWDERNIIREGGGRY